MKDSDGTLVCVYGEVSPNPEVKEVDACAKLIRENDIEFVVALGGGSALDCAKASATMCFREGESVRTYHGTRRTDATETSSTDRSSHNSRNRK